VADKKKLPWDHVSYRKLSVKDVEKIRYRVYRDAHEFVAVIADSALMAIKIAGVAEPFKVVRDLPQQQSAIEAISIEQPDSTARMEIKTNTEKKKTFLETLPRVTRNGEFQEISNAVFQKENANITPIIGRDAMLLLAAASAEKQTLVAPVPEVKPISVPVPEVMKSAQSTELSPAAVPSTEQISATEIMPVPSEELSPSEVVQLLSEPRND
jgi:hypothetical protein